MKAVWFSTFASALALTMAASAGQAPAIRITSPTRDTVVSGTTRLEVVIEPQDVVPTVKTVTFTIDGRSVPYLHGLCYPALSTVPGQPATAFPVGRSREGLPIGLQAVGPYLEDLTPIRFAALLAREIGGFRKPSGYDQS